MTDPLSVHNYLCLTPAARPAARRRLLFSVRFGERIATSTKVVLCTVSFISSVTWPRRGAGVAVTQSIVPVIEITFIPSSMTMNVFVLILVSNIVSVLVLNTCY